MDPKGKGMVVNDNEKESIFNEPRDDNVNDSGSSQKKKDGKCDGTSQVIRPTYSCPCPTDIRHPVDVPKSLDKFGIFFLTFPGTFHPSCRHYRTSEI